MTKNPALAGQATARTTAGSDYLYAVDVLRFLSAVSVMGFHLAFYGWANPASTTARMLQGQAAFPWSTPWAWFGWVGVEVFFVISGLVIANSASGVTPFKFVRGRMLRLLPAAWICATISLLAWVVVAKAPMGPLVRPFINSLVLWPLGPWVDGVYWSLAVECAFYALVFATLLSRGFRSIPLIAGALTLCSGLFLVLHIQHVGAANPAWRFIESHAEALLLRHGAFFALGIWIWLATRRRLSPLEIGGFVLATVVGLTEVGLRASEMLHGEAAAATGQPMVVPVVIWLLALAAITVFALWPGRFTPRSAVARREIKRLGQATYPLYLVHNVVGAGVVRVLAHLGAPPVLALAAAFAFAIMTSLVVASLLEPALRDRLRELIDTVARLVGGWRSAARGARA